MEGNYKIIKYTNKHGEACILRPSDEQLRIIVSELRQDLKIIACAGSGKTTTLVARLKFLIESGIDPKSIIISTFNVEAGRHIINRVKELVGSKIANQITIGNIDKIAFGFYSQYIKENQKKSLKKFGLSVKEYCYELFKFLQTRDGIKQVLDKFQYFFFDEFQDVNQLQYDILMLFKKHGCYLIVIGDDAQNIYGWRDSRIDLIQTKIDEDTKKYSGGTPIRTFMLSTNYRCSKPITLFSNQIIQGTDQLIQKNMRHFDRPGFEESNAPYVQCYKGLYEQNEEIIKKIQIKLRICSMRDIAILSPTNQPLKYFEEALEKHNQKHPDKQLNYVSLIGTGSGQGSQRKLGKDGKPIDLITLSTIHRSKGLEWKIVFFIGVNDEFFPTNFLRTASNQQVRLEECRRLFYVGCTRAINELYFAMTKNTNVEKEFERDISVKAIIEEMDCEDLNKLDSLLKGIRNPEFDFIYDPFTLESTEFERNNLYKDFCLFMDLYIQRLIGEKLGVKDAYQYEIGRTVLFSMFWQNDKAEIIARYPQFFSNRTLDIDGMMTPEQFVQAFNVYMNIGKTNFTEDAASEIEEKVLEEMFIRIKKFKDESDIPYNLIQHICVDDSSQQMKEYFPEDFDKNPYFKSFKAFSNEKNKTQDIMKDIYTMSKCGQLIELARRILYRNDFDKFNLPNLERNVNKFINYLKSFNYKRLRPNLQVQYGPFLKASIDLIADTTIYEIKTSQYSYISKEYILQVFAYAGLMKLTEQLKITHIIFFNPFNGRITTYNISEQHMPKEFIDYIVNKSYSNMDGKSEKLIEENEPTLDELTKPKPKVQEDERGIEAFQKQQKEKTKRPEKPIFNVDEFKQPAIRNTNTTPKSENLDNSKIQKSESTADRSFANTKKKSRKASHPSKHGKKSNESICIEIEDIEDNKFESEGEVEDFISFTENISKKIKTSTPENHAKSRPLINFSPEFEEENFLGESNPAEQLIFEQLEEQKNEFIQID